MAEYAEHTASATCTLSRDLRKALARTEMSILRGKTGTDPILDFARSAAAGLSTLPRRLDYSFLYDARGSALFDRITSQPEYYLTRTETAILAAHAHHIREITGPVSLMELGSGNSMKTDYLLRAWLSMGRPVNYFPVDVSISALRRACRAISRSCCDVRVIGVNADYFEALPLVRDVSPVMVLFLGSSIGNFEQKEMDVFFSDLSAALSPNDFFLLGIDLVKEPSLIEAAYNDAAGITAEFTRNLFARMNRELQSGIDLSVVEHAAGFNPAGDQVEIFARFARKQTIRVTPLGRRFAINEGEMIQTEICRKFRLEEFIHYTGKFGLTVAGVFSDDRKWFALLLLRRIAAIY